MWLEEAMMRKRLSAEKVKKLPVGSDVYHVEEATGKAARLFIVQSGKKKMLKSVFLEPRKIEDRPGWHYEVDA